MALKDVSGPLVLLPLRVPTGWLIEWNALYAAASVEAGDFGGSSVFRASHATRRFSIDVEFRPEFDPSGCFHLSVVYAPWPRSARGRRLTDLPLVFGIDAETVHAEEIPVYADLVAVIETWLTRCSGWTREGN